MFLFDVNGLAGARISTDPLVTFLDRKRTKPTQFDPVARRHGAGNFFEDGVYDALNVALVQMWVFIGNFLDQFRPYQSRAPRGI